LLKQLCVGAASADKRNKYNLWRGLIVARSIAGEAAQAGGLAAITNRFSEGQKAACGACLLVKR
jgi:hypothetical protein